MLKTHLCCAYSYNQGCSKTSSIFIRMCWSFVSIPLIKSLQLSLIRSHVYPGKATSYVNTLFDVSSLLAPENGTFELRRAYRITPKLQISAAKSLGSSYNTSGAMNPTVPAILRMHSSSLSMHAMPKSPILTVGHSLLFDKKILRCLRSLWTTFDEWMSYRPRAICNKIP